MIPIKYDHSDVYTYKFDSEVQDIEYDFTTDLATGDTVASSVVTCTDANGNSTTSAMISGSSTVTPNALFTISAGTVGMLYSIEVKGTTTDGELHLGLLSLEVFGGISLNTSLGSSEADSYITLQEANNYIMNKYGHSNTWDTLTIEGKKRLIQQAAIDIDTLNFVGSKYYDSQSMQFPRDDHSVITGNCATPFSVNSFLNSNLYSTTYNKYPENYWKYGSCHITSGTPVYDIRIIATSIATNGQVIVNTDFSATPTANTKFITFVPLDSAIKNAQCEQLLYLLQTSSMDTLKSYKTLGAEVVKIGDVEVDFKRSTNTRDAHVVSSSARRFLSRYINRTYRVLRA